MIVSSSRSFIIVFFIDYHKNNSMFGRFDTKGGVLLGDKLLLLFFLFLSIITRTTQCLAGLIRRVGCFWGTSYCYCFFLLFLSIITNNNSLFVRFDTKGGVLLGDKFTSVKKINDVRENCVRLVDLMILTIVMIIMMMTIMIMTT